MTHESIALELTKTLIQTRFNLLFDSDSQPEDETEELDLACIASNAALLYTEILTSLRSRLPDAQ